MQSRVRQTAGDSLNGAPLYNIGIFPVCIKRKEGGSMMVLPSRETSPESVNKLTVAIISILYNGLQVLIVPNPPGESSTNGMYRFIDKLSNIVIPVPIIKK